MLDIFGPEKRTAKPPCLNRMNSGLLKKNCSLRSDGAAVRENFLRAHSIRSKHAAAEGRDFDSGYNFIIFGITKSKEVMPTLQNVLESFNAPLNEEQAWAVCHQCAKYLANEWNTNASDCCRFNGVQSVQMGKDGVVQGIVGTAGELLKLFTNMF